jgi:PAS domain S-box-containing protein
MTIVKEQKELNMFKQAIELSDNSVIITDDKYMIIDANQTAINKTGFSKNELLGSNPKILRSGLQSYAFYEELKKTINAGKIWNGEFVNKTKDGVLLYERASIVPIKNNNKIDRYLSIKQDITKEVLLRQELIENYYYDRLTKLPNKYKLAQDYVDEMRKEWDHRP